MRALALVCLLAFSLGGFWGSTQYVAAQLGETPELGLRGDGRNVAVFPPWDWVIWDQSFGRLRRLCSATRAASRRSPLWLGRLSRRSSHFGEIFRTELRAWQLPLGHDCRDQESGPPARTRRRALPDERRQFPTTVDGSANEKIVAGRLGRLICHDVRSTCSALPRPGVARGRAGRPDPPIVASLSPRLRH